MRYCNNGGCMGAQPGYAPAGMNRTRRIIDSEYPIAMAYVCLLYTSDAADE